MELIQSVKQYYVKPNWNDFKEIIEESDRKTLALSKKHPWVGILTRWFLVLLAAIFVISCSVWGYSIHTEKRTADIKATALAEYQEEQRHAEEELLKSEAKIIESETEVIAKMFSGLENFEEKYGYSENDFLTYARCVFNRVDNAAYADTLDKVVNQESQWVGYSAKNQVIEKYRRLAQKAVEEWHHEKSKPISNDFVYAELTERGIFLKNDINADGYARRWRYGN